MHIDYKPLSERTPDGQYAARLKQILTYGELAKETAQGIGALTCFGTLPPMVFDIANGVPLINERKLPSWKFAVGEEIAFINGARTIDDIESYGCGPKFWGSYRGKGKELGLDPDDMGPGSYGAAFHDFPMPDGRGFNQFANLIEQIRRYPNVRSHRITPWIPYYTARGENRKVIVAPCHGSCFFRVINGKLHLRMDHNSADVPIGVPHNMIQYAALLLMVCQVTGYPPGNYIHSFADAHIYENQVEKATELARRPPRKLAVLKLDPSITDLFAFRVEHFTIEEYDPHPAMDIPFSP